LTDLLPRVCRIPACNLFSLNHFEYRRYES
jgi:hypothetical protein